MDAMEQKLVSCFSAVLPELSPDEIPHASAANSLSWDSVATVSLIAVIEEEFGISIEMDDLSEFDSFQGILRYLERGSNHEQIALDAARTDAG